MAARFFPLFLLSLASGAAAQPQSLGVFGSWGAFRSADGCHAVSQPIGASSEGGRASVAIGHWPGRSIAGQVHVRLNRPKRDGSAVLLRIDGRSFQLRGGGHDAWAPDSAADREIMAAMRTGISMIVETRAVDGSRLRDQYPLRGAATAMDAAAIECLSRD